MGKESTLKTLRSQLRNVVKETLPEVFTAELSQEIYKKLSQDMGKRMDVIASGAKETLDTIDKRNKDFQDYMIRQLTLTQPLAAPGAEETSNTTT